MAEVYHLLKCTVCKKRIKKDQNFTVWEKEHYCEPCFDDYLELIDPSDFLRDSSEKSD